MAEKCSAEEMPPGMAWRTAVSAVVGIGWFIFIIIFLFFWAKHYTIYENIAIFLVSILVIAAILAPIWIMWGIRAAREMESKGRRGRPRKQGPK
ncbi:MAG: hypothetical protein ABH852_03915 [Methanobacteriota archaeon]